MLIILAIASALVTISASAVVTRPSTALVSVCNSLIAPPSVCEIVSSVTLPPDAASTASRRDSASSISVSSVVARPARTASAASEVTARATSFASADAIAAA